VRKKTQFPSSFSIGEKKPPAGRILRTATAVPEVIYATRKPGDDYPTGESRLAGLAKVRLLGVTTPNVERRDCNAQEKKAVLLLIANWEETLAPNGCVAY
jgi:hypothetical protein